MALRTTPDEYAAKWARRLSGAVGDIKTGIARVTVAPGIKAAQAKDLMRQKLLAALDDGTWEQMVKSVSLDDWKASAAGKGADRISAGVTAAQPKQSAMASKLLPAVEAAIAEANKTPRGDLSANVTRMTAYVTKMAALKLRRPAGR